MIKYDELLRTFRDARGHSRRFEQQTRDFAVQLVRGLFAALGVPRERGNIDISSEDTGFDDNGWYRIRFSIRFNEYEGSSGGDEIWNTWYIRPEDGKWDVKLYPHDDGYSPIAGLEDASKIYERYAKELQEFLSLTLDKWVANPKGQSEMEKVIGFQIPRSEQQ